VIIIRINLDKWIKCIDYIQYIYGCNKLKSYNKNKDAINKRKLLYNKLNNVFKYKLFKDYIYNNKCSECDECSFNKYMGRSICQMERKRGE